MACTSCPLFNGFILRSTEMKDLFDLSGKTIIVTGSSRGIGKATAEQLAYRGANVCVSSRNLEPCQEVASSIQAQGGRAIAVRASISRPEDLAMLVAKTREAYGPVHGIVCNAATNPHYGSIDTLDDETHLKIYRNNVLSNVQLAKLVKDDMQQLRGGSIVIISSIAGFKGSSTIGAYGISKAADVQLARNLAVEWGPANIRVNCIAPGLVETRMAAALLADEALMRFTRESLPLRRLGQPEDIAGVAAFLMSDAASFVTGQTLIADGGALVV